MTVKVLFFAAGVSRRGDAALDFREVAFAHALFGHGAGKEALLPPLGYTPLASRRGDTSRTVTPY